MFWIALLGLAFSWMFIKLGFLSATVGILIFIVKILLFAIGAGLVASILFRLRKKSTSTSTQN